ncbi:MAG: thiamine pyrophosphate-binding protein [Betaproteobacteria bacterium]|nr:thiamine pyrophosphate-binding protein [Betaproteobacteria bacterium]
MNDADRSTTAVSGRDYPALLPETPMQWGSDAIAQVLRDTGVEYIALNPGASYRGLHDSLVNYLGNVRPQMLICLHEEHAVALAHGYAKVTERPMAAAVHSNVGLMHATMAIYNAWCDRAPVLVLGATGPVDAAKRRPWIDWLHTSRDQGALVRNYVKWDDQPASVAAALESVARANMLARSAPSGPVYVCFDVTIQEERLVDAPRMPDLARHAAPAAPMPAAADIDRAAALLTSAMHPVFLMGRVSRDADAWSKRIELAERLGARVITDLKTAASFPTKHVLHGGPPAFRLSPEDRSLLKNADVVLALDWIDLAGALRFAWRNDPVTARIINVTLEGYRTNGWSFDHQALPASDLTLASTPDLVIGQLLDSLGSHASAALPQRQPADLQPGPDSGRIEMHSLAGCLNEAIRGKRVSLLRLPLGWPGASCEFDGPMDYMGYDGGAGIGSGPGMAVGSALAFRGSGRIPVAVLGDGDLLMGGMALWTAARHRIPLLVIVADNRSFHNDEAHQEAVAKARARPVENKWIGQRLDDPPVDIPGLARSQGWHSPETVAELENLPRALQQGLAAVAAGECVLIDVRVWPGYVDKTGLAER